MLRYPISGMAIQAAVTGVMAYLGWITISSGQQFLAGVLYLVIWIVSLTVFGRRVPVTLISLGMCYQAFLASILAVFGLGINPTQQILMATLLMSIVLGISFLVKQPRQSV